MIINSIIALMKLNFFKNLFKSAFVKNVNSAILKSDVDKLNTDKLKTIPNRLNNSRDDVNKLNITKLQAVLVELKKLSHVEDNGAVQKL